MPAEEAMFIYRLEKIRTKQNKCLRGFFFARTTENVTAYFQMLEILKLENIFNLKISSLVYKIIFKKTEGSLRLNYGSI
jgi:hypothetical protein